MSENEVVIETQEVPLEESSMSEFKKARADGKETATRETVKEEKVESDEKDKPKVKGGFQARIDRLIKQQAALEEKNAAAEKRATELEAKLNGNGKQKESDEPKRESFESEADYIRALTRWEVKQEMKAESEKQQRDAIEAQFQEARSRYNSRMIALQEETPEYKELMKQAINVPTSIEGPVTLEMENGPEVVIFLAQNPEICEELTKMSPSRAIAEVWNISEKLSGGADDEETEDEKEEREALELTEKEKAAAKEEKPKLRPIRTVTSGSTTRSTIPLDKTDFSAYKKLRAQGRVQ